MILYLFIEKTIKKIPQKKTSLTFFYYLLKRMREKLSPSGEDFSLLLVWRITGNRVIPHRISSILSYGSQNTESKSFWDRHMWARGNFVASSGNVIAQQSIESPDGDFKVDGEL
jgi:REP element-mobilizing transposase RayT